MTEKESPSDLAKNLHRRAVERNMETAAQMPENRETLSADETQLLLHDLRVHQIELQMQTEELQQTQEKLEALLAKYFDLYDLAPVGYVTLSETGLILEANLTVANMVGAARGALVNRPFSRLILPEDKDLYHLHFKQWRLLSAIDQGSRRICDLRLVKNDGTPFWARLESIVAQNADSSLTCRVVISDITDHKQAEQDRFARQSAEEASLAMSQFVANMSHEIRTPLTSILGFAQVLERDPLLTPGQIKHVQTITRSGVHLLRLINEILDMSKINASTLNEAPFYLLDLLGDLEMMFRSRTDAKGLQLLIERKESLPRQLIGDEGKLRQICVNLMGNAIKFTETGGVTMRVHTEAVEGKTVEGKKAVRLVAEVEDTGPGIPDDDIYRIFGTFQQAEAGVKVGGTGLGLTISRRFVEKMGGKLTAMSQVGKGSCFRFDVLLELADDVADRKIPALRRIVGLVPGAGPYRILVVDDIQINRVLLLKLLKPIGFDVKEASDGIEALKIFEYWAPHAVLMDMRMPNMDGYEATRRLKSTEAGRATFVIAITANAFEDSRRQAMASGMDAYLSKPFRPEELFDLLEKTLGLRYVFAE